MRNILFPALLMTLILSQSVRAQQSWEERMLLQLSKRMTVDLVDAKLSDVCGMVAQFTGATIILDPKIKKDDPTVNLRVNAMDAGTFIKWMTKLTSTYAEVRDHAIFITDKPSEEVVEEEKNELTIMAATMKVEIDLPPKGVELTDADRIKIALKMMDKENYKPTDFPGPDIGIGIKENNGNAFGK